VYASSGGIVGNYERQFPYDVIVEGRYEALPKKWRMLTHEDLPCPRSLYSCSKIWGEALARYFSDSYSISIICLRFGRVTKEDRPRTAQEFSIYCSQRDAGQIVEKALKAPDSLRFGIFFVLSNNKYGYRDISHAQQLLGYQPRDAAESYRRK
jgi:nucleoside-diphosphate-sugar epimerase